MSVATVLSSLSFWSTGALNARPAAADQLSNAQAEAAQLQQQIQTTDQQIDALNEQYRAAELKEAAVDMQVAATEQKMLQVNQTVKRDKARLLRAGVHPSLTESSSPAQELLFATDQRTFDAVDTYSDVAGGGLTVAIETLQASEVQLKVEQARLRVANRQATEVVNLAHAADQKAQNEEAVQQQALSDVNGQIAQLVDQQQQESQAASAAAQANSQREQQTAAATTTQPTEPAQMSEATQTTQPPAPPQTASSSNTSATTPAPGDPPSSAGGGSGAAAVTAAESQLAVPYAYGAEQPGVGFDCSGLTAWAWGQAGVALPHYSGGQMSDTTPVPTSDLQPGDLLFYGPGGSSHVAMYIGGGQEIQAPYSGTVVSTMPADFGDGFVGAGRP